MYSADCCRPVSVVRLSDSLLRYGPVLYLGVWFDTGLKFSSHISHAVAKSNQLLVLIKRSFVHKNIQSVKLLAALVRPHLEYGNAVWHPMYKKDIDLLEKIQRRATRMVPGLANFSYEERLEAMDLPSLAYRRLRGMQLRSTNI